MYPSLRDQSNNVTGPVAAAGLRYRGAVSRNVVVLGLTSFFTDISSEALTAVLPLYFVLELRMTRLQFGLLDGLYQGASALVGVAGGLVTDAGRRYKAVAFFGYALSALCKLGLLLVGSAWAPIAALLMVDRLGKGIRTAPVGASRMPGNAPLLIPLQRLQLGLFTTADEATAMPHQTKVI